MRFFKWLEEFYFRNKEMNFRKIKETQKYKVKITKILSKTNHKTVCSITKNLSIEKKQEKKSVFDRMKNVVSFIISSL